MKRTKRALAGLVCLLVLCASAPASAAEEVPEKQLVGTALLYVKNSAGDSILVAQTPVSEMEADLKADVIDDTLYNYCVLDHYVTVLHQEAQGFTVPEYIAYAQVRSDAPALRETELTFSGEDTLRFWALDDPIENTGRQDSYTWNELYGVQRYNYPLLYQYWDYTAQDYYDPAGEMTREEILDYLQANAEETQFILSVNAFSQRYMMTEEKYETGDYDMENYWYDSGLLDSVRTFRMMMGMTEANLRAENLRKGGETASLTRYGIWNLQLEMVDAPEIEPAGTVAAPTATMTEDEEYYYIRFECDTPGAAIYYNHHYRMTNYLPTCAYTQVVKLPKQYFPDGVVTINAHAVKDGWTDAGVVTLELTSSGAEAQWTRPYTDVSDGAWYIDAVDFVTARGLFNGTSDTTFAPDGTMTRAMFATVLHRYAGTPPPFTAVTFTDVPAGQWYTDAVAWAAEHGYVNGTGNNKFSPDIDIPLEQMVTVLWRYVGSPAAGNAVPTAYGPVSSWAADAMSWAAESGLLNGVGGTLTAQGAATRAQIAAILMNFLHL